MELNSDSKQENLELQELGLEVGDKYWGLLQIVEWVNTTKYWVRCQPIIYTFATFDNRYERWHQRLNLFQNSAHNDPTTFDYLVEKLEVASGFHNQSTYPQMPVYK